MDRADIGGGALLYGHVTIQVSAGAGNHTGAVKAKGHLGRVKGRGGQGHGHCLPALRVGVAQNQPGGQVV